MDDSEEDTPARATPPISLSKNIEPNIIGQTSDEAAVETPGDELEFRVQKRTLELQQASEVFFNARELLQVTLASIGDAVITTDVDGNITFLNPVAERLTGWTSDQASGLPIARVFRILTEVSREPVEDPVVRCMREGQVRGLAQETLLIRRGGDEISIDDTAAPIFNRDKKMVGAVLIFRDVTERRGLARQLAHQADHDSLTGLANRRKFEHHLKSVLAKQDRDKHHLLYIDVDQFKIVNDTSGHVAGDVLLGEISATLRSKIHSADMLARLGGDEFGILLEYCSTQQALRIANELRQAIHDLHFQWEGKSYSVDVSIGLVPIEPEANSLSALLMAADSACYIAKEQGRNRVHLHEIGGSATMERQSQIISMARINDSLREDGFRLYYQPIVSLRDPESDRGEILLRVIDDENRLLLPETFLPTAERYNRMMSIDRWVVRQSLKALRTKLAAVPAAIYSINISGQSLGDEEFLTFVLEQFRMWEVRPEAACFEITETAAIAKLVHAIRFISTLRERGCHFALDDFGTGLSSFAYLRTLTVDYVKIAGCFIIGMASNPVDRAMVEAIHRIAHVMGIRTIAESVEDDDTIDQLRNIGVDYAQGYAVGGPLPIEESMAFGIRPLLRTC